MDDFDLNIWDGTDNTVADETSVFAKALETRGGGQVKVAQPSKTKNTVKTDKDSSGNGEKKKKKGEEKQEEKGEVRSQEPRGDGAFEDGDDQHDKDNGTDKEEDLPVKKGRRVFRPEDDPLQYHAKPRDLVVSKTGKALQAPRQLDASKVVSNHIFSRTPFSSLPLDKRLASLLEKGASEGGMGLASSTRVRSVVIPLLVERRRNVLMK